MLYARTNDILAIVCDFSIRTKNTVAQRILRTNTNCFQDAAPGPEQTAYGAGIGEEARAEIDYERPPFSGQILPV